jgi:uncharacterized protein (DUF1778 family)
MSDKNLRKSRTRLIIDMSYEDRKIIKRAALEKNITLRKFVIDAIAVAILSNKGQE